MFIWNLISAGLVAISALASAVTANAMSPNNVICGSLASDAFKEMSKQLAKGEAIDRSLGRRSTQEIDVSVYVHVVASSQKKNDGYISDETVHSQLQVLRSDYEPVGISFSLKSIDRTINATWAKGVDLERMWQSVRNGTYNELNIWIVPGFYHYGLCSYPAAGEDLEYASYVDGCTIHSGTVPGGQEKKYNLGKTLTHEVGHWFGLLHTFEGGCKGDGDSIDDTPAEASPSNGCPEGRDTCPDDPGLDPIHNFMDYSTDACFREFSLGQVERMKGVWSAYRAWAAKEP
ncbi:hypothetical protein V8C42DRAFT_351793 [Trichoderma barbatum]